MDNITQSVSGSLQATLTVDEAAAQLKIGRTSIWQLIRSGKIRSFRIGRLRRVTEADLADFIQQQRDGEVAA